MSDNQTQPPILQSEQGGGEHIPSGQSVAPGQVVAVNVGNSGGGQQPSGHGGVTALGVIATVVGSIALLGSFIPCLGALAIYLAIPAAICGIIGIVLANSKKVSMTLSIVGTVLAIIGGIISGIQIAALKGTAEGLEKIGEDLGKEIEKSRKENEERLKNAPRPPAPEAPSNLPTPIE